MPSALAWEITTAASNGSPLNCARAPKECLDIVRWDNSVELFIANLVAPSKLAETSFDEATRQVRVVLARDSTQPPGLALRAQALWQLTGWRLSVESPDER